MTKVQTMAVGGIIRLGQLLKLANLADTGAEARELIADGFVSVNGEVEVRRGRQLVPGDVVELRIGSQSFGLRLDHRAP